MKKTRLKIAAITLAATMCITTLGTQNTYAKSVTAPSKVTGVTAGLIMQNNARLGWKAAAGADGYQVAKRKSTSYRQKQYYCKTRRWGKYKWRTKKPKHKSWIKKTRRVKKTKYSYSKKQLTSTNYITLSGLKDGTKYVYVVRAYKNQKKNGKTERVYGKFSSGKAFTTVPYTYNPSSSPESGEGEGEGESGGDSGSGSAQPSKPEPAVDTTWNDNVYFPGYTSQTAKAPVDAAAQAKTFSAGKLEATDDPAEIARTSGSASDLAAPSEVTDLSADEYTAKVVNLSWKGVLGANGYEVYRSEDKDKRGTLLDTSGITKYGDTKVKEKTTYYYTARAIKTENGETAVGKDSETVTVTTPEDFGEDNIEITDTGITLKWTEPVLTDAQKKDVATTKLETMYPSYTGNWNITYNGYTYRVTRQESSKNSTARFISSTLTDCTVTDSVDLTAGERYSYTIEPFILFSATSSDGSLTATNVRTLTSNKYPETELVYKDVLFKKATTPVKNEAGTAAVLSAPTEFKGEGKYSSVNLSWREAENCSGYILYRDNKEIKKLSSSENSFTDTGLDEKTSYNYSIVSTKGSNSSKAKAFDIRTPKKPSLLPPTGFEVVAENCSDSTIDKPNQRAVCKWAENDAANSYNIYKDGMLLTNVKAGKTEYTDADVTPNSTYKYEITSVVTENGNTEESTKSSVDVTMPNGPSIMPPAIKAVASYKTVTLNWTEVPDADYYNIYRGNDKIGTVSNRDSVKGSRTGFNDTKLTAFTKYTYYITSVKGTTESVKNRLRIQTPDYPGNLFKELKNVKFSYGNTEIHLGQTWSSSVNNALASGRSGSEHISRPGALQVSTATGNLLDSLHYLDEEVYMYDTGSYDNFLCVYVINNQITGWVTNGDNMGSENGNVLHKGDKDFTEHTYDMMINKLATGSGCYPGVEEGGIFIGGFAYKNLYQNNIKALNHTAEKRVGLHFMNAYRMKARPGCDPLTYDKYLDGEDMTYSGTVDYRFMNEDKTETVKNVRFGAQAVAETSAMSRNCDHNTKMMKKGPLAGTPVDRNRNVIGAAALEYADCNLGVGVENSSVGNEGEACIMSYDDSAGHLAAIIDPMNTRVGIGIANEYAPYGAYFSSHIEKFGAVFPKR